MRPARAARTARQAEDQGHATLFVILGLTLALLALTVLFIRIGGAQDQRSQAQMAADAAALAAVGEIKDRAAERLLDFGFANATFEPGAGRSQAEAYAQSNNAVLDDIRASDDSYGSTGHIVRVEVRGALCQRELEEDGSRHWSDLACDGTEEDEDFSTIEGNAAAIAEVDMPQCSGGFLGDGDTVCDGVTVSDLESARSVIEVRLVEEEGQYLFRGPSSAGGGGGDLGPVDPGSNRAIAQGMLSDYGWGQDQWSCLDNLWESESNWDHTAENPSSGAYGIPQSLPADKMASAGADWRTNPTTQITWGLGYIEGRYGSPCAAWDFWQAQSPHWY